MILVRDSSGSSCTHSTSEVWEFESHRHQFRFLPIVLVWVLLKKNKCEFDKKKNAPSATGKISYKI